MVAPLDHHANCWTNSEPAGSFTSQISPGIRTVRYAAEAWRATTAAIETTRRASSAATRSLVGSSRRTRALAAGMARLPSEETVALLSEETVALLADSALGLPRRLRARICQTIRAGSRNGSDRRNSAGSCFVDRPRTCRTADVSVGGRGSGQIHTFWKAAISTN